MLTRHKLYRNNQLKFVHIFLELLYCLSIFQCHYVIKINHYKQRKGVFMVNSNSAQNIKNQQQLQTTKKRPEDYLFDIISLQKLLYDASNCYVVLTKNNHYSRFLFSPSQELKDWLAYEYKNLTGKYPQETNLKSFLCTLNFYIREHGEKGRFYNRFCWKDDKLYIDLGDESYSALELSAEGYRSICPSPVYFARFHSIEEIKIIDEEIDPFAIFDYINICGRNNQLLALVWMITSCLPQIDKPMLLLTGPAGSGKTNAARFMKSIFDPCESLDNSPPKNEDDFALIFNEKAIPMIDNVQSINDFFSDIYCRAITGFNYQKRALYTNCDTINLNIRRSPIITSINIPSLREDFLSRAITIRTKSLDDCAKINLSIITNRLERIKPKIVYTFIGILQKAISILPSIKLRTKTRMGDFDTWGCAISIAMSCDPNEFMQARMKNIKSIELATKGCYQTMKAIDLATTNTFYEEEYTSEQLFNILQEKSRDKDRLPVSSSVFGKHLKILSNYFQYFDIKYSFRMKDNITIHKLARLLPTDLEFVEVLEKVNPNARCKSCSYCSLEDGKLYCSSQYEHGDIIDQDTRAEYCTDYKLYNNVSDTEDYFDQSNDDDLINNLFI